MTSSFWMGMGIVGMLVAWRWSSRVVHLPFPARFGWMLHGIEPLIPSSQILKGAGIKPGMRVLDIGPGIGRVTIPAAHFVGSGGCVVAADIQPAMLAKLRRRADKAGVGNWVQTRHICADTDEFGDSTYDLVLMIDMLGEIPDRQRALRSACRALRPDGKLIIAEVWGDPHYQRWAVVREQTRSVGLIATKSRCPGGYYAVCTKQEAL